MYVDIPVLEEEKRRITEGLGCHSKERGLFPVSHWRVTGNGKIHDLHRRRFSQSQLIRTN